MKQFLFNHLKNLKGWRTSGKLVAFAVDDYGNIRLHSSQAKEDLIKAGVKLKGRFDHLDALDTSEDYRSLFAVLSSVQDKLGNPAIITPYALSCNPDFEASLAQGHYVPESLDLTYKRLAQEDSVYEGTYELILEGIAKKLIKPQFHGREHLNVHLFNAHLRSENPALLANLAQRSLAGLPPHKDFPKVKFNQAFAFWRQEELEQHKEILADGLRRFEAIYGYPSLSFTPPAQQLATELYPFLGHQGVFGIDKLREAKRHLGQGKYQQEKNYLGAKGPGPTLSLVRNCVFEPNEKIKGREWVTFTLQQVAAAFRLNKPAIISSHRVNFCGHIDPKNREEGLSALEQLLKAIVKRWPEVEFISISELVERIRED